MAAGDRHSNGLPLVPKESFTTAAKPNESLLGCKDEGVVGTYIYFEGPEVNLS